MKRVRMLLLSDAHVPDRALEIPRTIVEWIERSKPFDIVVYAGDLTGREILEWVEGLAPQSYVVAGNMDWLPLPEYHVFEIHGIKIGVVHGDQVYPRGDIKKLTRLARKLGVQVLISGHTHDPFIAVESGVLHINPGSVTGVPSGGGGSLIPSLGIAEIDPDGNIVVRILELRNDELVETLSQRLRIHRLEEV